jgi:hypothetical protein
MALQRAAGNHAVGRMIQRIDQVDSGVWSNSHLYVTGSKYGKGELGIAADVEPPKLAGTDWSETGNTVKYDAKDEDSDEASTYTLSWDDDEEVRIPKDCLTTAELVAAWLMEQDPEVVGEVKAAPTIKPANKNTRVSPGDILFHIHSLPELGELGGDFHGVAVIAEDEGDVVTMESDRSPAGPKIVATTPIFDMYAGHRGFKEDQYEEGSHEKTYVISFLDQNARSDVADTLWSGIQKMQFSAPATEAVMRLKAAIREAIYGADDENDYEGQDDENDYDGQDDEMAYEGSSDEEARSEPGSDSMAVDESGRDENE